MIEHYEFGKIVVNTQTYTTDIIILPNNQILSWWRKSGHNVVNEDLEKIYKSKPEIIILGTGKYGIMKVSDEVYQYCRKHNIKLIAKDTQAAIEIFNNEKSTSKSAGFHLTC